MRNAAVDRTVKAGCNACQAHWEGPQAQGTAARHTDVTGHDTWCKVVMEIRYSAGRPARSAVPVKRAAAAFVGLAPKPKPPGGR
jgi:hypothetical protein